MRGATRGGTARVAGGVMRPVRTTPLLQQLEGGQLAVYS